MSKQKTKIPEGWKEIKLGELILENQKSTIKVGDAGANLAFPFFTSGVRMLSFNNYLVDGENVYLATGGNASAKYFKGKASYSTDTYSIKGNKEVNTRYLYYILDSKIDYINKHLFSGSGLKHLQKKELKALDVLLPPLPIQNKIAEILETVDEEIEKVEGIIEKSEKIKNGINQQLFSDKKLKKKNWKLVKLSEISKNLDNKRIPITQSKRTKGSFPYYGATGIVDNINDYIFDEELLLISEDGANLKDRRYPIAFIVAGKFWVNNHAHIQKFNNKYLQTIVCKYFNFINLEPYLTGMAQPKLNKDRLNKILIPVPVNEIEQKKIAKILIAIDKKITMEQNIKNSLIQLKKGLMADLLMGKVNT